MRITAILTALVIATAALAPAYADCGSDDAKRYYSTAYEHKKLKHYEDALAALVKLFEECPDHHDGYVLIIDTYIQLDQADSAVAAGDRAVTDYPEDGKLLFLRGEAKEKAGDPEGAVADYKAAMPLLEDKLGVCYNIARMYLRTNVDSAMVYLECAIEVDSTQTGLWDALLQIYELRYRGNDEVRAKMGTAYAYLYEQYPDIEKYAVGRGKGLVIEQRFAEALPILEAAVQSYPENVEAWRYLGYAKMGLGDNEGALEAALRAIELLPGDGKLMLDVADTYRALGNYKKAIEYVEKAEAVIPGEPRALVIRTEISEKRALSMRCSNGWLTLDGDAALGNVIAQWKSMVDVPGWGSYAQARAAALSRARLTPEQRNQLKFFGGCP
jgi:tetratricopeptide (TPR) repeat protein